jgi:hypothetical protein
MPTEIRMFILLEHDYFNAYYIPRHHNAVHHTAHHQDSHDTEREFKVHFHLIHNKIINLEVDPLSSYVLSFLNVALYMELENILKCSSLVIFFCNTSVFTIFQALTKPHTMSFNMA